MATTTGKTEELRDLANEHLWMPFRSWVDMERHDEPLVIERSKGIHVWDSDGREWIDVNGGYTSVSVGYGRTEIAQAMRDQMRTLPYWPEGTTTPPLARLVKKLAELTPGSLERTWPVSGGSEANETAIKIARAYHKRRGEPGRYKIVSLKGTYHGGTGVTMWLGRPAGINLSDFEPEYPGMVYAPLPNPYRCEKGGKTPSECSVRCAKALEDLIVFHGPQTVAAVIAEPVCSGLGGVVPGDEYWPLVRRICDKHGVLLIDDEVVCGFGRTGRWFGIDHWDVVPDIMTMAKGLGSSYVPVGAAVVTREVADAFAGEQNILRQALTYGGHPVAAAVALKNIEVIEEEKMVENSAKMGAYFLGQLRGLEEKHHIIGEVRGLGLLMGIELVADRKTKAKFPASLRVGERLVEKFRKQGLLLRTLGNIIQLGPPMCITKTEVDEIVRGLDTAIGEIETELPAKA
ncbi:MAG: aspartate aminotransferase family protein [SAR202 cluster bacterium]|nr:aspartate aminotransferase family protein [SAR202 cluster bacterium]